MLLLFSGYLVCNSLPPRRLQPTSLLCPPLSPGICSNPCPLSQQCYLTISSSAAPFSFCLQSFPESRYFPISQLFTLCSPSIGASASATILPPSFFCPVAQSCLTLCDPMDCSTPGFPVLHHLPELPKLMCTESVMASNHLILCRPLLLVPSMLPSIRVFSNKLALPITWPKYWSFSFSISLSN